jgi:hypothetical protein
MVVVASQTNRGPGLVDTGTLDLAIVLGAPVQPGTEYIATTILDAVDRDDPTLILGQVTMYLDGQIVWGPTDLHCGLTDRNGNPVSPGFFWGFGGAPKTTVRVTFDPSRRVRIGLDVSTRPIAG